VHAEDPADAYVLAAQTPVTAVSPVVAQYEPAVHAEQAVDPVDDINVPERQFEQLVEEADDEYVPDKQLEHIEEEATEYEPAAQAPVTAVIPVVAQYEPAVHAEHDVDPVDGINVPARQFEQLVEEADDEYVPDKQLEHIEEEATEYQPAAQAPVTAVSPVVAQYDPLGHAAQVVDPVDA